MKDGVYVMNENKKIIYMSVSIIIIVGIIFLFVLLLNPSNSKENNKNHINEPYFPDITYHFDGKSEHFSFDNGKVYFSDTRNMIFIDGFQQDKKIDNMVKEKLSIYFDGNEWGTHITKDDLNVLNKKLEHFSFYEGGFICDENSNFKCETGYFSLVNKDNFKDMIKIKMTYCFSDENCKTEDFELNFTE